MITPGSANALLLGDDAEPPLFIGSAFNNGTGTLALTVPAGAQAGDLFLVALLTGNTLPVIPSGFTSVASVSSNAARMYVATKISAGETSITYEGSGSGSVAILLVYQGVNQASPVDAVSAATTGSSTTATTGTVSTAGPNERLVHIWGMANTSVGTADAATTLRSSQTGQTDNRLVMADEIRLSAGATSGRTATFVSSGQWSAFAVALKNP